MQKLSKLHVLTLVIVLTAVSLSLLWLFVPAPPGAEETLLYSPLGTPLTLADLVLAIGSGLLFWRAIGNFKKELKPAYRLIASAQVATGILTLVFPYIEYYGLWDNVWLNMSSYLPYLIGSILMYFGARQFLKVLGIASRATSFVAMACITLLAWGIHAILPHPVVWADFNELQYDIFELVTTIPVLFYGAGAFIAFKIRRGIGADYRKAFGWLAAGLTLLTITTSTIYVLDTIGYENWYFSTRAYAIPTLIADIIMLTAAYQFNAIGLTASTGPGVIKRLLGGKKQAAVSSLDIITHVAGMVSNPAAIDPSLDKVRIITSQLEPGAKLTSSNEKTLRTVYLEIEKYLVTADPLRSYNQDALRQSIVKQFALDENTNTFWSQL